MKKYYLIGLIIAILIIIILLFIKFRKRPVEISSIKYFHFSYDKGYMMNANIIYEVNYNDNKYLVKIKPYMVSDEDALEKEISSDEVKKIEDILVKYNVNKWDGFQRVDKNVLDGNSFSLSVGFMDENSIHASGYMMYPKGYGDVRGALDEFFMNIYDNR